MKRFEGKTVLLTGAKGGIGAALLKAFRDEGARVAAGIWISSSTMPE